LLLRQGCDILGGQIKTAELVGLDVRAAQCYDCLCHWAARVHFKRGRLMNTDVKAIFPSKPSGMPEHDYSFHVENGQCARLLRGECSQPCSPVSGDGTYSVDFDHIVPRAHGGMSTGYNFEPKCSSFNRWIKRDHPDPFYSSPSFFDKRINPERLRLNQFAYGYNLVKTAYKEMFEVPSKEVLRSYMLLAWIVGSGKTIGMCGILHAVNEVINAKNIAAPRIFKVLWLVHQETLVHSIQEEVRSELTKYGILDEVPNTAIVETHNDWVRVTPSADYVFACTQSLWDTKNSAMDEYSRRVKLSKFDAIVIDEGHFAVERYEEIFNLAPHALKFVMTATPFDGKGTMLSRIEDGRYQNLFKLFSVYGYKSARKDGIVKEVKDWDTGLESLRYIPVEGGDSVLVENGSKVQGVKNTSNRHNSPRENAIIKTAISLANGISDYPAHVMIRTDPIIKLKSIIKSMEESPTSFYPHIELKASTGRAIRSGWGVSGIYTGSKKPLISDPNHPWMMVKKRGQIENGSKRVLLAVNMGQFGLNNPYCGVVAWTSTNLSLVELIQRIGRAIRIIYGLNPDKQEVYLVFSSETEVQQSIKKAIEFILDMEEVIKNNFLPLGDPNAVQDITIRDSVVSIPPGVKATIHELQGLALPELLDTETVEEIASKLSGENQDFIKSAVDSIQSYVENLLEEDFKNKQFGLPSAAEPLRFVFSESAKDAYSQSELISYAQGSYPDKVFQQIRQQVMEGNAVIQEMLTVSLKQQQDSYHFIPAKFYPVAALLGIQSPKHSPDLYEGLDRDKDTYYGVLKNTFSFLINKSSSKQEQDEIRSILASSLRSACAFTFGLPSFSLSHYAEFEPQLSSTMCSPVTKRKIINQARAIILDRLKQKMPGHYLLYINQILTILEAINEKGSL
jgi:hypothetical protein